ncbi:tetratricopeptide repeat protein [Aquisalibacillus elongatus]|uniref:Uncharacterized protein n=1 Tax=Aquisalibacillus elongatus TaxID=485577 RepID=A0A3N5BUI1_9BACI|nr:hypothetical protein [Aquisalibacillus elongatus]RPF53428.1 hypothetical protein EDC24_1928 [Aquisalibacillus elongatus]
MGQNYQDIWKQYVPSEVNESIQKNSEMWKQEGDTWEATFDEAKKLHEKAVAGDEKAVKEVFKLLKDIKQKAPSDHLIEAYYGSVVALLGRDAADTKDRFRLVRKGMKILDDVVKKEPEHSEIRMLRGYVSYNIPEMYFQRTSTAVEDFEYLINQYESNPEVFSQDMYWQLLYDLGIAYKRTEKQDQAQQVFTKLSNLNPNEEIRTLLSHEGIDDSPAKEVDSTPTFESNEEPEELIEFPQTKREKSRRRSRRSR